MSAHLPCCSPTEASMFSFMWLLIVPNRLHLKHPVRGEKVHTCVGGAISLVLVILTGSPRPCSLLWWCCPWYWRCLCCSVGHHNSFFKDILYSYYSFQYMYTLTHIQRGWLEGMVMRWDEMERRADSWSLHCQRITCQAATFFGCRFLCCLWVCGGWGSVEPNETHSMPKKRHWSALEHELYSLCWLNFQWNRKTGQDISRCSSPFSK